MLFKITDEEYAVLCEIRNNQLTSPDRLKMMFFSAAEPAIKNLEDYDLIRCEISQGLYFYYATEAGKAYRHQEQKDETSDIKEDSNKDDFNDYPTDTKPKQRFYKSELFWTIAGVVAAVIAIAVDIINAVVFR